MQDYWTGRQAGAVEKGASGVWFGVIAVLLAGLPPIGLVFAGFATWRAVGSLRATERSDSAIGRSVVALVLAALAVGGTFAAVLVYWLMAQQAL